MHACIDTPLGPTQPFAVREVGAGVVIGPCGVGVVVAADDDAGAEAAAKAFTPEAKLTAMTSRQRKTAI